MKLPEAIRRCLRNGPKDGETIRMVSRCADQMRYRLGLDYDQAAQFVEQANRGTVKDPREVWEELLYIADTWESAT